MININKIFTKEQTDRIEHDFEVTRHYSKNRSSELFDVLEACDDTQKLCMKFLYAYMPVSDIASYNGELFLKAVNAALKARECLPWGDKINGELFLNYVLCFRINNENLVDYREQFFNELYPRVKDLSMYEAVIEVNYWCFEKATYQSTDVRTSSPLNVICNAFGRCGEESVLCVAALRSVGIPARQCYTPRWAHCDDNHAWVEVFVDGKWHFIGACEPEPVLDKGWFTSAALRGMLIHTRVFSTLVSDEEITKQNPLMTEVNILNNYATTKILKISVVDEDRKPVEGAQVRFELINFAQLFPIATLYTDKEGMARFMTGLGDLYIHVSKDGKFLHRKVDMRHCDSVMEFLMADAKTQDEGSFELDLIPPKALSVSDPEITDEKAAAHELKSQNAIKIRNDFENTFIRNEKARKFAENFMDFREDIENIISLSNGNHNEISKFLLSNDNIELKYKVLLLKSLNKKDLSDTACDTLMSHIRPAIIYKDSFDEEIFVNYILCPRVHFEMITDYRGYIENYFRKEQINDFRSDPYRICSYIQSHIKDSGELDYSTITASPGGLLQLGVGSRMSKKILFVAICRTFGIPARVNKINNNIEYIKDNKWNAINLEENTEIDHCCELILQKSREDISFDYEKNFTIAILENGIYTTLGLNDVTFDGDTVTYKLQEGKYRITTANRMHDGSILAILTHTELKCGERKVVEFDLREQQFTNIDGSSSVELPKIPVMMDNGDTLYAQQLLPEGKNSVIAYIEEGKEPTEHLLNEILEETNEFSMKSSCILLLAKSRDALANKTLNTALKNTGIRLVYLCKDNDVFDEVINALGTHNRKLPLVLGLSSDGKCIFHSSGYNVGMGNIILKHLSVSI